MLPILIALNILILSALVFSIRDCYLKRGPRLTFNFFFFSFFYILFWIWRDVSPILLSLTLADKPADMNRLLYPVPPEPKAIFTFFIAVITLLGWMSLFYLGWFIAEKILQCFDIFKKRLFLTLFLSSLVISVILCPIVKIISIVDWQKWLVPIIPNDIFLIGHPRHPFMEGFYFSFFFLAAYFLIECSQWKDKNWKMIFFLLPFIHLWTIRLFGSETAVFCQRIIIFIIIVILAFLNRSKLIDLKS